MVLTGPRQCGKTTLAHRFVETDSVNYFDLESPPRICLYFGDSKTCVIMAGLQYHFLMTACMARRVPVMTADVAQTAERLYAKLRRYRVEAGFGWLDAWQVVEETPGVVGNPNVPFSQNIPSFAKFLNGNVKTTCDELCKGVGTAAFLWRVSRARNSAVHRGTWGKRLEEDVGLTLRLTEEALAMAAQNSRADRTASFYMVRGFHEASPEESLASARDTMLRYDYSVLPVPVGPRQWRWLTATVLARHASFDGKMSDQVDSLDMPPAKTIAAGHPAKAAALLLEGGEPALLVDEGNGGPPIGILTAFDLLYAAPKP